MSALASEQLLQEHTPPARNWDHLPPPDQYVSPEEYFAILDASEERLEWIDGVIYPKNDPYRSMPQAMAGASDAHVDVHVSLSGLFYNALRGKPCRVVNQDQKIKCGESFAFPDITVYCGEREKDERGFLTNAVVIVEVLSPSTRSYDHNQKWEKLRQLATLRDYLLVWPDKLLVEHRRRQSDANHWDLIYYNRLEDEVELESVDARLRLAEIYERIKFTAEAKNEAAVEN